MNQRQREDRRQEAERRASVIPTTEPGDNLPRPHRDAERECLDLKARLKEAELYLAAAVDTIVAANLIRDPSVNTLVEAIDNFLPATEGSSK